MLLFYPISKIHLELLLWYQKYSDDLFSIHDYTETKELQSISFTQIFTRSQGFPGGTVGKNLPATWGDAGDVGSILGWEDPLDEEMATHPNILAWEVSWIEEPGGLQSTGS